MDISLLGAPRPVVGWTDRFVGQVEYIPRISSSIMHVNGNAGNNRMRPAGNPDAADGIISMQPPENPDAAVGIISMQPP